MASRFSASCAAESSPRCTGTGSTSKMNGNFTLNYYGANPALSGAEPQWTLERETHSEW